MYKLTKLPIRYIKSTFDNYYSTALKNVNKEYTLNTNQLSFNQFQNQNEFYSKYLVYQSIRCFSRKSTAVLPDKLNEHKLETKSPKKINKTNKTLNKEQPLKGLKFTPPKTNEENMRNIQDLVMKSHEFLTDESIGKIIEYLDQFRAKLTTRTYKTHKSAIQAIFLNKCKKLFQKHGANEVLEYLKKCDIHELSSQHFTQSFFRLDEESEFKEKISKYNIFAEKSLPRSEYILDDIGNELENTQQNKQSDVSLIEKVSRMSFGQNTHQENNNNSDNNNKQNELEFEQQQQQQNIQSIDDQLLFEGQIQFEGGDNTIVEDDLNEIGEERDILIQQQQVNKYQNMSFEQENKNGMNLKFDFENDEIFQKFNENSNFNTKYQPQDKKEILFLYQQGFKDKKIEQSNWLYLYNLPYKLENETELHREINVAFQKSIGNIQKIKFFKFQDFLDFTKTPRNIVIQDNLDNLFGNDILQTQKEQQQEQQQQQQQQQQEQQEQQEQQLEQQEQQLEQQDISQSVNEVNNNNDNNLGFIDKLTENEFQKKKKKSDRILTNLQQKSNKKLDKSYALIMLDNYTDKLKALSSDLRLFGVLIDGKITMIDDADYKLTLNCYNIQWGTPLSDFCSFINSKFKDFGLDIQMEVPENAKYKLSTKYYVLLRFNSLHETIKAMAALQSVEYYKRYLKVQHVYGGLKARPEGYVELIDIEHNDNLLERIESNKLFYIKELQKSQKTKERDHEELNIINRVEEESTLDLEESLHLNEEFNIKNHHHFESNNNTHDLKFDTNSNELEDSFFDLQRLNEELTKNHHNLKQANNQ